MAVSLSNSDKYKKKKSGISLADFNNGPGKLSYTPSPTKSAPKATPSSSKSSNKSSGGSNVPEWLTALGDFGNKLGLNSFLGSLPIASKAPAYVGNGAGSNAHLTQQPLVSTGFDYRTPAGAGSILQRPGNEAYETDDPTPEVTPTSFADYLKQAQDYLSGTASSVNYDPQRNALRSNASTADTSLAGIYKQLQDSFAAADPGIASNYAGAGSDIAKSTADAQGQLTASNDSIRNAQTQQLAALGIGDALPAVQAGQAADQAAAAADIASRGQSAALANTQNGAAARTYNTENGQTAGLEGASKRAGIQTNLLSALANVDANESTANAQLKSGQQNSILSLAQALQSNDPNSASALAAAAQAQQESAAADAQQQFENQLATNTYNAKYGSASAPGSALNAILDQLNTSNPDLASKDPSGYAAILNAMIKGQSL